MQYDEAFARHSKIALQFSGGKDSLAVLHLMRPYWDRLTAYFVDSGDQFPEHLEAVRKVAALVPSFVVVDGRRREVEQTHGWPSDIVTSGSTPFGRMLGHNEPALVDRYTCCFLSIMKPMYERMKADGVTLIIRGQKNDDELKPPVLTGTLIDGFEILNPIENMTTEQVFAYLREVGATVPACYDEGATSAPDCMHCTAWLEHKGHKYVAKHHPQVAKEVTRRLWIIKHAVAPYLNQLSAA